jgi:hypothetical protein
MRLANALRSLSSRFDVVQIDTTNVASDTIDYVATDSAGRTSTRTVIIEPTVSAPIPAATSTAPAPLQEQAATSTSQ